MRSQLTIDLASKTNGLPVAGATVTVKKVDGTNATLYAASTGGTLVAGGNPLTSDADGMAQAWLERGKYRLVYGGGITRPDEWIDATPGDDGAVDSLWLGPSWSQGTLAARPDAAVAGAGARYFATDDWGGSEYVSTGAVWVLVASKNRMVLDLAAAASGTFSGLNGDTDLIYLLDWEVSLSASAALGLRPNNDATAGPTYVVDAIYTIGGAAPAATQVTANSYGTLGFAITGSPIRSVGHAVMQARTGGRRHWRADVAASVAGISDATHAIGCWWLNTASNITSLVIVPSAGTITGRIVLRRASIPT